ncbi:fimbrial protein [Stenotrophomonas maltophilia]|uniref:fimbrial protein n=1 Tax=Stenotrophomonas maltophilia TaxID=40324 RepID=UPI0028A89EA0|nr:fimbrial protein [Stenotrophomonas geniculata]HEL7750730.1 type 1 fimbrial protein [Stenotrophomonas maltophilia]
MNNFRNYKVLAVLVLLAGAQLGQESEASCYSSLKTLIAQDISLDMGEVTVVPGAKIGSVIMQKNVAIHPRLRIGTCDAPGGVRYAEYVNARQKQPVAGLADVYETDVVGVGVRVSYISASSSRPYPYSDFIRAETFVSLVVSQVRIELIKTSAQTGSGLIAPMGRFTTYYLDGDGQARPLLTTSFNGSGTTIVSPTCDLQVGGHNAVVDFGHVASTIFTGVGSRGVARDFQIRLKCPGVATLARRVNIHIRLDGDQDSSGIPGTLRLSAGPDSATGIGIQLTRLQGGQEQQVKFGVPILVDTFPQFDSAVVLALRARYVQTRAGPVGAGEANGLATFTIQYE